MLFNSTSHTINALGKSFKLRVLRQRTDTGTLGQMGQLGEALDNLRPPGVGLARSRLAGGGDKTSVNALANARASGVVSRWGLEKDC